MMCLGKALLGAVLAASCSIAGAGELEIRVRMRDDGRLELRYTPPPGVRELIFFEPIARAHQQWRGAMMTPADNCTTLNETAVVLRNNADCTSATVLVTPRTLVLDAVYQPAQPLSDGSGVLAYSGHYAVLLKGQGLRWRWDPPKGGTLVYQGRAFHTAVEQPFTAEEVDGVLDGKSRSVEVGAGQYIFLGRRQARTLHNGGTLVLDPGLDAARAGRIEHALQSDLDVLSQAYGVGLPGPGAVIVPQTDLPGYHGDTTYGRMMRLSLPRDARTMDDHDLEQFVAHEVTHWWNHGVFDSDPSQPWLHEGHAEWMARLLLRADGQYDDARLRNDIETRLNNCLAARGERPAVSLKGGRQGDDVYACGMSLMLLGQAQVQSRQTVRRPPIALLASLHSRSHPLDVASFIAWADGDTFGGPMARLLLDPQQGFGSGFVASLQALGLADVTPFASATWLTTGARRQLSDSLLTALMRADCAGAVGFWSLPQSYKLQDGLKCSNLRGGAEVLTIEGQAVPADPVSAWAAVEAACAAGKPLRLGYADGLTGEQPCPTPAPVRPNRQAIRLRADALKTLGLD